MNANLKKTVAALGVASLMVVGIASAQDTATTTPEDTTAEVQPEVLERPAHILHDLVLEYTGLDEQALQEALQGGSTLSDLITANGKTVEDFTAAVLAEYDARATEARTNFADHLTAVLSGEESFFFGGRGGMRQGMPGDMRQGGRGGFGGGMGQGQFAPPNGQQGFPGQQNQQGQSDTTVVPPIGTGA